MKAVGSLAVLFGVTLAPMLALGGCNKPAPAPDSDSALVSTVAGQLREKADDVAAAKTFLESVYSHYKTAPKDGPGFDITSTDVVDPDLARLIKDDNAALHGDVGVLDYDWMCSCQDFVNLQATITVTSATATTAHADADVVDTGMSGDDRKPRRIGFDLATVGGAWRIHDVRTKDQPSLREALTKEIADLKKGPKG